MNNTKDKNDSPFLSRSIWVISAGMWHTAVLEYNFPLLFFCLHFVWLSTVCIACIECLRWPSPCAHPFATDNHGTHCVCIFKPLARGMYTRARGSTERNVVFLYRIFCFIMLFLSTAVKLWHMSLEGNFTVMSLRQVTKWQEWLN